tara:strand:- start:3362 stop:3562 length:201 start_codon:yes stop_codon:yes gene_type:complete
MSFNLKAIFSILLLGLAFNYILASVQGLDHKVSLQCSSAEYLKSSVNPKHQALVAFCEHEGFYVGQ